MKTWIFLGAFFLVSFLYRSFEDIVFSSPVVSSISGLVELWQLFPDTLSLRDKERNSEWINLLLLTAMAIHLIKHVYFYVHFKAEVINASEQLSNEWESIRKDFWIASAQLIGAVGLAFFVLYRKTIKLGIPISESVLDFGLWVFISYIVADAITLPLKYSPLLFRALLNKKG